MSLLTSLSFVLLFCVDFIFSSAPIHDLNWRVNTHHGDVNIVAGTNVRWTWTDGAPHDVFSRNDRGSTFTSSAIMTGSGTTYMVTFTDPGEYYYICTVHGAASMDGTIVVTAGTTSTTSTTTTTTSTTTTTTSEAPISTTTDPMPQPCCLYKERRGFIGDCLTMERFDCLRDVRCRWCQDEVSCRRFDLCGIMNEDDLPTHSPTVGACCLPKRNSDAGEECDGLEKKPCRGDRRCRWCESDSCGRYDQCNGGLLA